MAAQGFRSRPVPNLIQGVSQQAAQQRRDTQCEAQGDCLNSVKFGAVARHGGDVLSFTTGLQASGAFVHELLRGTAEHYLLVLKSGALKVFDLNTGLLCQVTDNTAGDNYLASANGVLDVDNFRVQTVNDTTFIVNKSITPVMANSPVTAVRNPEALVFFQAGNYMTTYVISLAYQGTVYRWKYTTPDNSAAPNAAYITANQICATFYRAMTGLDATLAVFPNGVGGAVAGDPGGSGGGGTGHAVSVVVSPTTIDLLGFSIEINGNLLHIYRTSDTNDFTIDASDGTGDTQVLAFKDTVQTFSQLPKGGFNGFLLKVVGVDKAGKGNNFYVQYQNYVTSDGFWLECPAPGIKTTLNNATMPHSIFSAAPGAFTINKLTWLPRICGDGVNNAVDPGFVGSKLQNIFFFQQRLALLTEGTLDFSEPGDVYTFFPDTVQALLATAPFSITLAAAETTALLRTAAVVDESLVLWAQLAQFRINSGIDPFQAASIQDPPSTNYEFNEKAPFAKIGTTLYFSYEVPAGFARIFNVQYQNGRALGDTDVTAHVSEYIPAGVRRHPVSSPLSMMFVATDGDPSALYLYNFLNEGSQVVQSAWNRWQLPVGQVIWHSIYQQTLYVALQRTDGLMLLTVPLNVALVDAGVGNKYRTRLDMRLTETQVRSKTYSAATNLTTITLPFTYEPSELAGLKIVIRLTSPVHTRGRSIKVVSALGNVVTVAGDLTQELFYLGLPIYSYRQESTFYIRTATGVVPTESCKIRNFVVDYEGTGYTRLEITQGSGQKKAKELFPLPPGSSTPALGQPPVLGKGALLIPCDTEATELTLTMINDSHLPSRWTSAEWQHVSVERPVAMVTPYGGPIQ